MQFKILIVEDTKDTRELLHYYFTNAGFVVLTASNGGEGAYLAQTEQPDIILSDLMMPTMSGLELLKHLRAQPETAGIPIIVFTAFGKEMREEAIAAGAEQVFSKPFDFDKLVDVVHTLLTTQ